MKATFRNKEASFTPNPYPYPTLFTGGDTSGAKVILNPTGPK
jgi:hypothetical protein